MLQNAQVQVAAHFGGIARNSGPPFGSALSRNMISLGRSGLARELSSSVHFVKWAPNGIFWGPYKVWGPMNLPGFPCPSNAPGCSNCELKILSVTNTPPPPFSERVCRVVSRLVPFRARAGRTVNIY